MCEKIKIERVCKYCGKNCEAMKWILGLCESHYRLYKYTKDRLPRHLERAKKMQELVWLVEGKPEQKLDTSGTTSTYLLDLLEKMV